MIAADQTRGLEPIQVSRWKGRGMHGLLRLFCLSCLVLLVSGCASDPECLAFSLLPQCIGLGADGVDVEEVAAETQDTVTSLADDIDARVDSIVLLTRFGKY